MIGDHGIDDEAAPAASLVSTRQTSTSSDVTGLIHLALERNVPVETLERLVALHERVAARAAASEFAAALAQFQDECPPISKTSTAKITTNSGSSFSYSYAELPHIANVIRPLLHQRGFSYSWNSEIKDKLLSVTCTLRHVNGHHSEASFASPIESKAGMSEQQKMAAALSYAKRMSLIQVLGITTADPDLDGGNPEPITAEQVAELKALAKEGNADEKRFLQYLGGYESFEKILRKDFNAARIALQAKIKAPRGRA